MSWVEVKKINSDLTTSLDAYMKSEYGKKSDLPLAQNGATLFSWIKAMHSLMTNGGLSIVKSIQRGVTGWTANSSSRTIAIAPVVVEKSIILLNGSISATNTNLDIYILDFRTNNFTLNINFNSPDSTKPISWQLIEFY